MSDKILPNSVLSRRQFIASTGIVIGAALLPQATFAIGKKGDEARILTVNNLHTGEMISAEFFDGVNYNPEELARLNTLFRDFRRNEVEVIDPRLFDQIHYVQRLMGCENRTINLFSGYRAPATNKMLSKKSSGVAKKSYHMLGQAMDFNIEGTELANVRKAALSLQAGGVGYYPSSNFVHIDTGAVRRW